MSVETEKLVRISPESVFATAWAPIDEDATSIDPAERMNFLRPSLSGVQRFDTRSDDQLMSEMLHNSSPLERERAIWELADRRGPRAIETILQFLRQERVRPLRWGALWLLQKCAKANAAGPLSHSLRDPDIEIRDWSEMLLREISGQEGTSTTLDRPSKIDGANPFSQTLPLVIAGEARTLIADIGWVRAVLSPIWFESIMGRVMACTQQHNFYTHLVVEKKIEAYCDGSDRFETFGFAGMSHQLSAAVTYHTYETHAVHPFFPSGKADDKSAGVLDDVNVVLNRVALTVNGHLKDHHSRPAVTSVRGRYMGWAYVNTRRLMANGLKIGAGEVQLSSPVHPVAGPLTNTMLFGTFKGKLSDLNGDGYLDVNTERACGAAESKAIAPGAG